MHFLHISRLVQLTFLEDIFHVPRNDGLIPLEQLRHLCLSQPDSVLFQVNFETDAHPIGLIKDNIAQRVLPRRSLRNAQRRHATLPTCADELIAIRSL